ncbi:MAG: AmmeMemoRadiSam system radical SAM enzyme [Thermoflexia bacterium]|nr:MAG: AmmeMemoRadiSam system radical SAM enzyme [Thermoflexia bacterium]
MQRATGTAPASSEPPDWIVPVLLQEPLGEGPQASVRCLTCERRCVVAPGKTGWCRTRQNCGGHLYTLIYGIASSLSANPIEKKPLYHFYPGSVALTVGSWSCNFACPWCQNWEISKASPFGGEFFSPDRFVAETVRWRCQGTSVSFNEPTLLLEWSLEVFRLARAAGLYNTFVTNGYMTEQALELLAESGLDGMNVDVKGDVQAVREYCQADVEVVWRNLRRARGLGIWVEVTTLVVPGVNDNPAVLRSIGERILRELGPDTPWHLTRYYPAYRFTAPPTPVRTLEQAREQVLSLGLRYVYIGNVPGHPGENTYCPACGATVVHRYGLQLLENLLQDGRCPFCNTVIPGVGWGWAR